jgi:hypothetical protein
MALAAELDEGSSHTPGALLLGETGTALFRAAAGDGAGADSLTALAELHESSAAAGLPALILRAELIGLLLGGVGILAAGAAFYGVYSGVLAGTP